MTLGERKSRRAWRAVAGMTLVELLVALTIFAVLGVLGYRAVAVAVESRERMAGETQRWRNVANLLQVIELDLLQRVERPGPATTGAAISGAFRLESTAGAMEVSFLKLDGADGRPARRGYRFEKGQVWQLRWLGTDSASDVATHAILDRVDAMRCVLVDAAGARHAVWPDDQAGSATRLVAIEIQLELPDAGTIRRLIAL